MCPLIIGKTIRTEKKETEVRISLSPLSLFLLSSFPFFEKYMLSMHYVSKNSNKKSN